MSEFAAELIGTMLLILLGNGVVAGVLLKDSKAENGGWLIITLAWGLAVTFAIYAVGDVSGAHINPAVTLGLATIGEFPWEKVPTYLLAQMLGAMTGALLVWIFYLPHWKRTEDAALKSAVFCTAPAIRTTWSNIVSEMIGTFVLLLGLLFIGANKFTEGLNPLIVGFLILAIGLSLGGTTGYAINPARDLGPRIMHALLPIPGKSASDWGYGWIPVVGPAIGGIYGALFYQAVFEQKITLIFWVFTVLVAVIISVAILKQLKEDR
ncbi:MAG: MIP/aquaporin family protein [Cyclobacteriaceae bacterium]